MSGHNKVEDIHPSHAFLSLPDVMLPPIGSSLDAHLSSGRPAPSRRELFQRQLERGQADIQP